MSESLDPQILRMITKIERVIPKPPYGEWEDGLVTGLEWAVRVLKGDKSAD